MSGGSLNTPPIQREQRETAALNNPPGQETSLPWFPGLPPLLWSNKWAKSTPSSAGELIAKTLIVQCALNSDCLRSHTCMIYYWHRTRVCTTGSTMFHRMSVCILILTNLLSLAFCSIPSLRFCEAVFHGSQSVQEDWIRHLQKHILDLRFNKACPPPDPERPLVPGIEPSATTTTPVLLAPLVV